MPIFHRLLPIAASATGLMLVVAGCGSSSTPSNSAATPASSAATAAQFPLTVKAANGPVKIQAKPAAIVSLSPTATEMLYAIGAGPQVKAVDKYSDYPPSAPHSNLDGIQLNVEAITTYKPDLVITQNPSPADKKLNTLGVPVLNEPSAQTLDQEYQQFLQLGEATGHAAEATAVVTKIKDQVSQIAKSAPTSDHAATYYFELDPTYYSMTSATFVGAQLKLLGLSSIADSAKGAAAGNGSPQLSAEFILKANPDYIFLADTRCCQQSLKTVQHRPGWSTLDAVKAGRVLGLDDDIASRWGPRIVVMLQAVLDELKTHPVKSAS